MDSQPVRRQRVSLLRAPFLIAVAVFKVLAREIDRQGARSLEA